MFSPEVLQLIKTENMMTLYYRLSQFSCIAELCQSFGQVHLVEHHGSFVQLSIPRVEAIGDLFNAIEMCKELYSVSSYSVSQTSLEQIF